MNYLLLFIGLKFAQAAEAAISKAADGIARLFLTDGYAELLVNEDDRLKSVNS